VLDAQVGQRVGLVAYQPVRFDILTAADVRLVVVVRDVEPEPVLEPAPQPGMNPEILTGPAARVDHGRARLGSQVPLPYQRSAVARVVEGVRHRALGRGEEVSVTHDAVDVGVLAGHERSAEGRAYRV